MTKENFNLKLELHHRRERQTSLEAHLETAEKEAEKSLAEQAELQEVNDQLLAELEKRDQAVEEAVSIIVGLEDKVARLMKEREVVQNFQPQEYDSSYFQADDSSPSSSPPQPEKHSNRHVITRMPSFLSDNSEGAEALKSLYLPYNRAWSEATLPKLQEEGSENGIDRMGSPRLSVLSESSFVSIYGDKNLVSDAEGEEEQVPSPVRRNRKSELVKKWMDEGSDDRPKTIAPILRNDTRKGKYLSIDDVMDSPLQRIGKLKDAVEKSNATAASTRLEMEQANSNAPELRQQREPLSRVVTSNVLHHQKHGLPPTPDTISTSTLRRYQPSNETLSRDSYVNQLFGSTSTFPGPLASHVAHQSAITRPRSAGETITSRREGHGWDTETPDDMSSTSTHFSAVRLNNRPGRSRTPDLFNFAASRFDPAGDSYNNFGRDVLFNDDPDLPPIHSSRHETLRNSRMAEQPRSDDTVRAPRYDQQQEKDIAPIESSPRRYPPARRSSLSHSTKLRKSQNSTSLSSEQPFMPPSPAKTEPKKRRITNLFLGRSETAPTLNTPQNVSLRPRNGGRAYSQVDSSYEDDRPTATPPPIKRSRDSSVPRYRPSSAGVNAPNTLKRVHAFGGGEGGADGGQAVEEQQQQVSEGGEGLGKKKWFGLGRSSSTTRRN